MWDALLLLYLVLRNLGNVLWTLQVGGSADVPVQGAEHFPTLKVKGPNGEEGYVGGLFVVRTK